jgi:hypothetical protein
MRELSAMALVEPLLHGGVPGPSSERDALPGVEITLFEKAHGGLTKTIELKDGQPISDSAECRMAAGTMSRLRLAALTEFANLIETLPSNQALALGAMRDGLPETAPLRTKDKKTPGQESRDAETIRYREGRPALVLLDHDVKGLSTPVREKIDAHGGFVGALAALILEFDAAGYVRR